MTDIARIDDGPWPGFTSTLIAAEAVLHVRTAGPADAPTIIFAHSILTSSAIWRRQATIAANRGLRAICLDMRGHGRSRPTRAHAYAMGDLVADTIAVADALDVERFHHVGVSQGGMIGLGLAIDHAHRLHSATIVAARADAPSAFAAGWDERIDQVARHGAASIADATIDRWFGPKFTQNQPALSAQLWACIASTSTQGFIGCAKAIQGLDYLDRVGSIHVPTTLAVGVRDAGLLTPMRELAAAIPGADFHLIEDAGHLPQLDQPDAVDAIFARIAG